MALGMRIACIHVPQYALQCCTRLDPSLHGLAVAVVSVPRADVAGARSHAPRVIACSRAAWNLGVRIGMTAAAAHSLSASVMIVSADLELERQTARAAAEALLGLTQIVELGRRAGAAGVHFAMYAAVPANARSAGFGSRVAACLEAIGITCRIGIADDRFTAWVAATRSSAASERLGDRSAVVSVPRGASAAYLAPLPLTLLQIPLEVQHMLELLGVRTIGEFAALPAPSVALKPTAFETDYQALARGESGATLRPYVPEGATNGARTGPGSAAAASTVDPLSLVLSTSGALFSLSAPKGPRYRRMRRGKPRPYAAAPMRQARLFDRL